MKYLRNAYKKNQLSILLFDLVFIYSAVVFSALVTPARLSIVFYAIWPVATIISSYVFGAYDLRAAPGRIYSVRQVLLIVVLAGLVSSVFVVGPVQSRVLTLILLAVAYGVYLFVSRAIIRSRLRERGRLKTLVVLGTATALDRLAEIRRFTDAFHDISVCDIREADLAIDAQHKPDLIVFEPVSTILDRYGDILVHRQVSGVRVTEFINWYASFSGRIPLDLVDHEWLLQNYRATSSRVMYNRVRRTLDIVCGLALAILSCLPCVFVAALIVASSPGSPLFKQVRLGQFRRPFEIYKLRSMKREAEKQGPQWAQPNDARTTTLGNFLRKTHFDELPQAWNLLQGNVTLIGPRPIRAHFADQLTEIMPYYELRFLAKPGISGWSQVIGPYGSNVDEHKIKLEMDLYYIQNAGLFLDLYILMRTARLVLGGEIS